MAGELVQSTAITVRLGPLVDSAGTPNAGLTVTAASIWVCKNEVAFALKSNSLACAAESLGTGWYGVPLDDVDTGNPGNLIVYCNYSGVLPAWREFRVVKANQSAIYTQLVAQAASTALANYDPPTHAEISSALTAIDTLMKAQAASLALSDYNPPTHAEISAALTAIDTQLKAQAASTALSFYDPPTHAEISSALTAIDTQLKAQAASTALSFYDPPTKAEMDTAIAAQAPSTALSLYDPPTHAEISSALTAIQTLMVAQAPSTALSDYDPPTLAEISAALTAYDPATPVWAALRASHTTSSSFGALIPSGFQKNKACSNITFMMVDSTDHRTPKTGLTVTGYVSLDGAAYGAVAGTIAEISNGTYQFDAVAADMNGDKCMFRMTGSGADDCFFSVVTIKTVSG